MPPLTGNININYGCLSSFRSKPCHSAEHSQFLKFDGVIGACPVYVQSYSTTKNESYLEFLEEKDINLAYDVKACGKVWLKYYCKGGEAVIPEEEIKDLENASGYSIENPHWLLKPKMCRHRHFCFNDAEAYTELRVDHAYQTLMEFASKMRFRTYLIHLIFTFPKEIWQKGVENPDLLTKCVYKTLDYWKGFKGGVLSIHFTHSSKPYSGYYPHVHVLLLNVVVNKMPRFDKEGNLRVSRRKWDNVLVFRRKRPRFNRVLMWIAIKRAIEEVFGYKWIGKPNFYEQYVKLDPKNERKIKHLMRYVFRLPIQDFKNVDFSKLTKEEKDFVWELLNYCKNVKRIRWFGFLADGVKSRYLRLAGVDYEKITYVYWKIKKGSSICPIHGIKMVLMSYGFPNNDKG